MTTTCVAPALAISSASRYPPSMVFRSATTGVVGNRFRSARTPCMPSAIISGVPASSQSTPARRAISAVRSASSMSITSREIWTIGFMARALLRAGTISSPRGLFEGVHINGFDDPLLERLDAEAALVGDAVHHDRKGVPLPVAGLEVPAEATDALDEPALAEDPAAQVRRVEAVVQRAVHARHRQAV